VIFHVCTGKGKAAWHMFAALYHVLKVLKVYIDEEFEN